MYYLLLTGVQSCHEGDDWKGIFNDLSKLHEAYYSVKNKMEKFEEIKIFEFTLNKYGESSDPVYKYKGLEEIEQLLNECQKNKTTKLVTMQELNNLGNQEIAHIEADKILCNLLSDLGYSDIVEAFEKVNKWYA